ncbi:alkylhydroperoxidase [Paraburkholderia ginsengiterrae]|uniref:Alkylhydroperoxidase n=1 Tax=Paraburkholderia ginsengiterrae TaxID=1462993 RepID=A0A1A9N7G1_9BURK|nr:carboxymuconolactone decarboxylase family protein [Paraburkholderia ginsengiterrae]OAJ59226.1 alkylhydroperoxidase [Paraburkholderia ginsengiterrae]OAJ60168.1 alkylhydroperoxidase [Paraburkholderia ginsengiterrae]
MSRIAIPAISTATGATAEVYAQVRKAAGSVPNLFAALGALSPDVLKTYLSAEGVLAAGTLSKQDGETIKLLVSELTGCDYCVAAHTMLGKMTGLSLETLKLIRAGQPTGDAKRDALVRFVRNLQQTSGTITAVEFAAIKAAGYTDAQLVEITLAIALTVFTNTFNRINDTDVDFPPVK